MICLMLKFQPKNSVSGEKLPDFFVPLENAAGNPLSGGNFRRKISAGNKILPVNFPTENFPPEVYRRTHIFI